MAEVQCLMKEEGSTFTRGVPDRSPGDHVSVVSPISTTKSNVDTVNCSDSQLSDKPKPKPKELDEVREKSPYLIRGSLAVCPLQW